MEQEVIDQVVAAATGEAVWEIRRRGFVLANLPFPDFDPEPSPWSSQVDEVTWFETISNSRQFDVNSK
jgi:hypothetical protein